MAATANVAKQKVWWISASAMAALAVVAVAGWYLLKGSGVANQASVAPPVPAVGVHVAGLRGVSQSFEFVGRIKAVNKVDVRTRVEGFLEKVLFREGQDVKAGDLLYQ